LQRGENMTRTLPLLLSAFCFLLCVQAQQPVTLVWDSVTNAVGYKLYWGATNSAVFTHSAYVAGRDNTNVTIAAMILPARVAATSVGAFGDESHFSEAIRVVNQELVRVYVKTNQSVSGTLWKDAGTVYLGPPQGSGFWRLDIQATNGAVQAP
jgi:hypothetical protein